ncbi:MAG: hypothetical protein V4472_23115 [Pseudomonadota bacterium]
MEGYTQRALDDVKSRYGPRFLPDRIALLLERRPRFAWAQKMGKMRPSPIGLRETEAMTMN